MCGSGRCRSLAAGPALGQYVIGGALALRGRPGQEPGILADLACPVRQVGRGLLDFPAVDDPRVRAQERGGKLRNQLLTRVGVIAAEHLEVTIEPRRVTGRVPDLVKQRRVVGFRRRSEEHTSELQSRENLVCRLLLEKKNTA